MNLMKSGNCGIGIINFLADFVKGRTVDWKEAVGFIAGGLFFLFVYAMINLFVNRSKCFENLDDKEKDEKKGKLSFWILFAFFVVVSIVPDFFCLNSFSY